MTQLQKIVAKAKTLRKSYPNAKWTDLIKKASKLVTPASKSVGATKKKSVKKKSIKKYAPVKPLAKKKKAVKRSTTRSAESEKVRRSVKKDGFIMPHGYGVTKGKRVISGVKKEYLTDLNKWVKILNDKEHELEQRKFMLSSSIKYKKPLETKYNRNVIKLLKAQISNAKKHISIIKRNIK